MENTVGSSTEVSPMVLTLLNRNAIFELHASEFWLRNQLCKGKATIF